MSDKDEFGAFLIGFIVGGLTGAVTALLLAPQSGEETRVLIKEKAVELKDKTAVSIDEAYKEAEKAAAQARTSFDELANKTREQATELTKKSQVVLEEQRSKISDAIAPKKKTTPKPGEGEAPAA
ncbi:MAG: YtxH domain-containing protein [Anaerolineae bacterium]|nr:YtxH domain-containing protein [Anaerolineae bacterium]